MYLLQCAGDAKAREARWAAARCCCEVEVNGQGGGRRSVVDRPPVALETGGRGRASTCRGSRVPSPATKRCCYDAWYNRKLSHPITLPALLILISPSPPPSPPLTHGRAHPPQTPLPLHLLVRCPAIITPCLTNRAFSISVSFFSL